VLQPAESSWIEPLVLALYRPTIQLATLLVRDNTVAQDIVQEAFVRVWLSPRTPREMSAQLFDWRRNAWTNAGALTAIRASATATVLPDGQVLIAGGFGNRSVPWASAELYDPLGTPAVAIRPTRPSPAPIAGAGALLGITTLLLALALWLRRARIVRAARTGEIWVD